MNNKWVRFLWIGALLAGLPILGVVGLVTGIHPWWSRPLPPIPPQAMQVQTGLRRDYTSVVDGIQRDTEFEIDQSEAAVQEFYRSELTKQGWSYRANANQRCGAHLLPPQQISDVYDRGERSLAVDIIPPSPTRKRRVVVSEYQGKLRYPIMQTPVPNPGPRELLIGDWQTIDAATGKTFVLCMYEPEGATLLISGEDATIRGKYQWVDGGMRLMLDTSHPVGSTDPVDGNNHGRCSDLPTLLINGCRSKVVDPAAYPGPDGVIRPRPTQGPLPSRAPYPAPLPPITEYLHIEEVFGVSIEQDSLTLTGASGIVQTFSRVMQ